MRNCRKETQITALFFFALAAFYSSAFSAPQASDTSGQSVSRTGTGAVSPKPSQDSSLIIKEQIKAKPVAVSSSNTASFASRDSSAADHKSVGLPVSTTAPQQVNTGDMFRTLGKFHKGMGIFTVAAGAIAIIAGASVLDKQDILPFSLSLITIGGIAAGIGVWEIHIGLKISR